MGATTFEGCMGEEMKNESHISKCTAYLFAAIHVERSSAIHLSLTSPNKWINSSLLPVSPQSAITEGLTEDSQPVRMSSTEMPDFPS